MLLQGLHRRSLGFYSQALSEKFYCKNDKAKNEQQQTDAIDAMHVFNEICFGTIRIWSFNV